MRTRDAHECVPVYAAESGHWLLTVDKPARYTGHEWNAVQKRWAEASVRMALAYPDTYEVGMSNLGLQILYDTVNRHSTALCERAFAPWPGWSGWRRAMTHSKLAPAPAMVSMTLASPPG
jgi:hypothetical protein